MDCCIFAAWSPGKADSPWPSWRSFVEQSDKNKDGVITLDEFDADNRDFARGMDSIMTGKSRRRIMINWRRACARARTFLSR
jgi:hypothetical protein